MLQSTGLEGDAKHVGALTGREQHVATLVCHGLSNKDIAQRLGISEGTVKSHVHRILRKLGVQNRCALILALSPNEAL
jgi:two-component system, NarL family, nitrate/nitrite response regulator NarL